MSVLYNISIHFYLVAIHIASLFNSKAKLWTKGRKRIFQKITEATKNQKDIVWFHCASLGEFEQGKPIIEAYKEKYPTHKILLTFFSPSGFEIRKNYKDADWIFYLPADTNANAKQFVKLIKPLKVFFIKYEFWFNYITECKKQNIPFYSVSSIFRKEQFFFKYKWFAKQLQNITHFFVQDKTSADLLKSIGLTNYTISGDSRFDSVISTTKKPQSYPLIENNMAHPNFTEFTLGDMYRDKVCIVESLSYTFPDSGTWETDVKGLLLPKFIDVAITLKFVENIEDGSIRGLYSFPKNGYATTTEGLARLSRAGRIIPSGNLLRYLLFAEDKK